MKVTGEHLLTRAGFTGNENRRLGSRHLPRQFQDAQYGRGMPNDFRPSAVDRLVSAKGGHRRNGRGGAGLARHSLDPLQIKRLYPVVPRAKMHQAFGFLGIALVSNNDNGGESGVTSAEGEEFLHLEARQGGARKNDTRLRLLKKQHSPFHVFGHAKFKPGVAQRREDRRNGLGWRKKK